jgi:hypothetical protein
MKNPRLVLLFLLGVLTGALANRCLGPRFMRRPGPPSPDVLVARFTRELALDAEQQAKARAIISEDMAAIRQLHLTMRDQLEERRNLMRTRIGDILRPDQRPRYEKLVKRWEAAHRRAWGGGAPPPPPPPPPVE